MRIDEARREILAAFVERAGTDGWTERCLRRAAADIGAEVAGVAFPRGVADVIAAFMAEGDARAARALARRDLGSLRMRERIAAAVRLRLEIDAGHKQSLHALVIALARPRFAALGARGLYDTVDTLWYAVGDTATDFSFYTKRALLAGVYAATLMFWLDDRSAGSAATWRFLENRIAEVMGIQRLRGRIDKLLARRPFAGRARRAPLGA